VEHIVERLSRRLFLRPAGQGLSDWVQESDAAVDVGGKHGIANAGEDDTTPLRLEVQRFVGLLVRVGHTLSYCDVHSSTKARTATFADASE